MANIPSVARLVEETDKLPNATLERAYREIGRFGGIHRFGKLCLIPETVEIPEDGKKVEIPYRKALLEYLRGAILNRCRIGDYFFESRRERKRLKRVYLGPN
jgi:hypothetical protein